MVVMSKALPPSRLSLRASVVMACIVVAAEFAGILEGVKSVYTSEVALGSDEFIQMLFSIFDDDGAISDPFFVLGSIFGDFF